jgi:predicted HD phosphohydrolase
MEQFNLLHDFFNLKSDSNEFLEASRQEKLEQEFADWFRIKLMDFEFVSRCMMKHISEKYHPHTCCLVDSTKSELLEGQKVLKT